MVNFSTIWLGYQHFYEETFIIECLPQKNVSAEAGLKPGPHYGLLYNLAAHIHIITLLRCKLFQFDLKLIHTPSWFLR